MAKMFQQNICNIILATNGFEMNRTTSLPRSVLRLVLDKCSELCAIIKDTFTAHSQLQPTCQFHPKASITLATQTGLIYGLSAQYPMFKFKLFVRWPYKCLCFVSRWPQWDIQMKAKTSPVGGSILQHFNFKTYSGLSRYCNQYSQGIVVFQLSNTQIDSKLLINRLYSLKVSLQ